MILLSVTGLFRTILIIVGVIVILRFFGKLMMAKRAMDEQNRLNKEAARQEKMVAEAQKNFGKTSVTTAKNGNIGKSDGGKADDFVDYEEIHDD